MNHPSRVFQVFVYWVPPFRRIPPLLWIRVRNELGFYLVERGTDGMAAYGWYHRQFLEAAERRYLADDTATTIARRAITDYFDGLWVSGRQSCYDSYMYTYLLLHSISGSATCRGD